MASFPVKSSLSDNTVRLKLINKFRTATKKLVLLDYDGTLAKYETEPHKARPSQLLSEILLRLFERTHTEVFIITGRGHEDIDKLLDPLQIDIIAEHGAMIKEKGIWKNLAENNSFWKKSIIPVLNQVTSDCPGSFVEEKSSCLTWHYRNADSESGYVQSRKLIAILEDIIHDFNLKILDGNKVVDIVSKDIGKGKAVRKLVERDKYDIILSVGDDATDEDMFEFLLTYANAYTIKVGPGNSVARYKLKSSSDVILLLNELTR